MPARPTVGVLGLGLGATIIEPTGREKPLQCVCVAPRPGRMLLPVAKRQPARFAEEDSAGPVHVGEAKV